MTNREAIAIVENMMFEMGTEGLRITRDEEEAIDILLRNTKTIEALNEFGNVGYMISAEELHKALEKENDNQRNI